MAPGSLDDLESAARRALDQAVDFSFSCQQDDGHWVAPLNMNVTFTAQHIMLKYAIPGLNLDNDGDEARAYRHYFLGCQSTADGSWSIAPGLPGDLSNTVEAYLALRLLGVPTSHPALLKARAFVLAQGGAARVRFFTRLFLASFGLLPWSAMPQLPAELVLLPTWAALNIYVLASWARSVLIPILVICHHQPVYPLPNGRCEADNDFLDELWVEPACKNVPLGLPLWHLFWGRDRDLVKFLFTLGDRALARLGGLRKWPLRRRAVRCCVAWLLEHQDEEGDWAGIFPAMHHSVWALLLEGFELQHGVIERGLQALERFEVTDDSGKWIQSTISPSWDTGFMAKALCDAGLGLGGSGARTEVRDARMAAAADWARSRQHLGPRGDWRIFSRNQQAGGWSFQYYNAWYPDVDDTAVILMMLAAYDPAAVHSQTVANGLEWILGMQSRDGGWGGFDIDNNALWLQKIPFADMEMGYADPSSPDVAGRVLECFAQVLAHRRGGCRVNAELARRLCASAKKALAYLIQDQTPFGAWFGRWGCNYIYGTANVLRALPAFYHEKGVAAIAIRAVLWLEGCQNEDGGWGETLLSYDDATLAGRGPSTAAQTAWALDALLRFRPASDPALQKAVRWLVANQNPRSEEKRHFASWPSDVYTGTGFPRMMYIGYPFYHHYFPISALARFLDGIRLVPDHGISQRAVTALHSSDEALHSSKDKAQANSVEIPSPNTRLKTTPCAVVPTLPSQWRHTDSGLALSGAAAASLVHSNLLAWDDLDPDDAQQPPAVDRDAARLDKETSVWEFWEGLKDWLRAVVGSVVAFIGLMLGFGVGSVQQGPGVEVLREERQRDTARLARVERSLVDLEVLMQNIAQAGDGELEKGSGWVSLDERFARRWQAAVDAEFQGRFGEVEVG